MGKNEITLHREGGRPPWVFEWNKNEVDFVYRKGDYCFKLRMEGVKTGSGVTITKEKHINGISSYYDVTNKIHASHFKLGNVTISFD